MNFIRKNSLTAAGIITILVSSLVIAGWLLRIPVLTSVSPDFISMKFNTAICFLFTGISLLMIGKNNSRNTCAACLVIVMLISILTLVEYIFSVNIGIDELFWTEGPGTPYTIYPGRPSALTAINFLLLSFVLLSIRNRKIFVISWTILFISFFIAAVSIVSYFFGNPELISIPSLTVIALHTALLFLVICAGIYYSDFFRLIAISFQRRMISGFLVIAFVILLVVYLDTKADRQVAKTADLISNHTESIALTDAIIANITRLESGVRGYLLTQDSSFLKPIIGKKDTLEKQVGQLKNNIGRYPHQQLRMDTLSLLVAKRIILLDSSLLLAARPVSLQSDLRNILVRTPVLMNRIIVVLNDLKKREQELSDEAEARNKAEVANANNVILFLGFTILVIFLSLIQLIFRTIKARTHAEAQAVQLAVTLEQKVKHRTAQLDEVNTQLHQLTLHLQDEREDEQRQLSREVNDEIGQLASAVKMDIDWLALNVTDTDARVQNRISHANQILKKLIDDVRRMASSIRPVMIDELGLNESLRWLCDQFSQMNESVCVFQEEIDDTLLSMPVRTGVFRICQKVLNNITVHTKATRVEVLLREMPGGIQLVIKDNAVGFNAEQVAEKMRLLEIRERALSINGTVQIESEANKGNTILLSVPLTIS